MKYLPQALLFLLLLNHSIYAQDIPPLFKDCAIVDYDAPLPKNSQQRETRKRTNSRYDNEIWVMGPPREQYGGTGRIDEEAPPVPYPVFESSLVAVGKVTGSAAFLSNDRHGIYTEFAFQISEILKNDEGAKRVMGDSVIADRAGGCVRYSNGKMTRYRMSDHGVPFVGKIYLLFLKREGPSPNYKILNGYEINGDKPGYRLEIYDEPENYRTMTAADLIAAVRYDMANPVYRRLDIGSEVGSPISIRRVKTGFGEIAPGNKFPAEYNWLRRLTINVENKSEKPVTYVELCLCFPRPDNDNDKPQYSDLLDYGIDPRKKQDSYTGYRPKPVLPGEQAEIDLDDFRYRFIEAEMHYQGYKRGFSNVRICVKAVGFEDGTIWERSGKPSDGSRRTGIDSP